MGIEIRYPNITAPSEKEQLLQMKSYLYQLVEQLQYALNNIDTSSGYVVKESPKSTSQAPAVNVDAATTFSSIKSLIIKSADIVQAYYDVIRSKLQGEYASQSAFGTFVEQTEQTITQSSKDIVQAFTDIQKLTTDLKTVSFSLAEVNARIKTGVIDYDDDFLPIYGVEVGQENTIDGVKTFRKYARFTADRLSFYDQYDREVAYISDRKLYISDVEVLETFKMGGFKTFILGNGDTVEKWVKGG